MRKSHAIAVFGIFLVFITSSPAATWNVNVSGNWGTAGNWSPATVPNSTGATATLGGIISSARTITLNNNYRIGTLSANSTQDYTINRTGPARTLRFDVSSGSASINLVNSGNLSITGTANVALADPLNIAHTGTGLLTLGTSVSGAGAISHSGTGTTLISGSNTFTGATSITGGQVIIAANNALGNTSASTSVSVAGTLSLQGGITTAENLTISGSGTAGSGALQNLSGSNRWNGNIALAGSAEIQNAAAATTLTVGTDNYTETITLAANTLTVDGPGNTWLNSEVTGPGSLIKTGSGTLTFYANENSYTGGTFVNDGTLELDTITGLNGAIKGTSVTVGDGIGAAGSAIMQNGLLVAPIANEMINNGATITFREDGLWNINAQTETVAALNMTGGQVTTGTGQVILTSASAITSLSSASTASVAGNLNLAAPTTSISVANGSASTDVDISAAISGTGNIIKTGDGNLRISGTAANTISGSTTINGGTIELAKSAGVNSIAGNAITVNSGGTLMLGNANQINDSAGLTLNGGTLSTGGGFNETLGTLTLSADSTINLGSAGHLLVFANSSAIAWAGHLTIYGWNGLPSTSGTNGQVFFGSTASGLTGGQLGSISFAGFGTGAILLTNGELVPMAVPDGLPIIGALIILGTVIGVESKKYLRKKTPKPDDATPRPSI